MPVDLFWYLITYVDSYAPIFYFEWFWAPVVDGETDATTDEAAA